MSNQHRPLQFELINDGQHVVTKSIHRTPREGEPGRSEPAPRNAINVIVARKFRGKLIEYVRCVPTTCQEDQRPARAAPIEYFKSNVFVYFYKLHGVAEMGRARRR